MRPPESGAMLRLLHFLQAWDETRRSPILDPPLRLLRVLGELLALLTLWPGTSAGARETTPGDTDVAAAVGSVTVPPPARTDSAR
ncbi:MAG: hypothetical protein HYV63_11930 [Candidatus Schekmanbacteria bacterium]|nr:hypothetical protein [Candidatus Schekmanbacteria bacterium]